MKKNKKPMVLRIRRQVPPPGLTHKDRKKEASKKACRKKVRLD